MAEPLFMKPVFHEKIWGGRKLAEDFNYQIPDGKIGECWAISGHPHGSTMIKNGLYKGQMLPAVYQQHPELFGNPKGQTFPLLVKILDAEDNLSVQVHPDDAYAKEHGQSRGKTECWYIISAEPGAEMIYGHNAKTKQQLAEMVHDGDWEHLLNKLPVKSGDFIFAPAGTVHALNEGIVALETQQSSDTTYRLYDYDRVDAKTGQKRPLHLQQAIDTATVPFVMSKLNPEVEHVGKSTITTLVSPPVAKAFTVWKWQINGDLHRSRGSNPYLCCSVIKGEGVIMVEGEMYPLKPGDHFILTSDIADWTMSGDLLMIASAPEEN